MLYAVNVMHVLLFLPHDHGQSVLNPTLFNAFAKAKRRKRSCYADSTNLKVQNHLQLLPTTPSSL
jgi:hypothetical protein